MFAQKTLVVRCSVHYHNVAYYSMVPPPSEWKQKKHFLEIILVSVLLTVEFFNNWFTIDDVITRNEQLTFWPTL